LVGTFLWAFDDPASQLSDWLLRGEGVFWISGKPGAGKSTITKFLWSDSRTWELLNPWKTRHRKCIKAHFFFHHGGTLVQKSFEGLLRSVIAQILLDTPQLGKPLLDLLDKDVLEHLDDLDFRLPAEMLTRAFLQDCLGLIINQKALDVDIFLMFDALDEYNGSPQFIADFLTGLTKDTPKDSRTRVKILFSSRPWNVFAERFKDCHGFKIHEHTQHDIKEYCYSFVAGRPDDSILLEMAGEICRRAQGVFLWVKLVWRELDLVIAEHGRASPREGRTLRNELRQTLDRIPDQLNRFYATIIERISPTHRWDAYVLLECLVRSRERIDVPMAFELILFSAAQSLTDATNLMMRKEPEIQSLHRNLEQMERRIATISGGLIDFQVTYPSPDSDILQLMHQTVREFVDNESFRRSVFGSRRLLHQENGHSFLAKYYRSKLENPSPICYNGILPRDSIWTQSFAAVYVELVHHLREAERSNGVSQYSFFGRNLLPQTSRIMAGGVDTFDITPPELSAAAGLRLFFRDFLATSPAAVHSASYWILTSLARGVAFRSLIDRDDAEAILEIAVDNGCKLEMDIEGFMLLIEKGFDQQEFHDKGPKKQLAADDLIAIICTALDKCCSEDGHFRPGARRLAALLHHLKCPSTIVAHLLRLGADPSFLDDRGRTPLDVRLARSDDGLEEKHNWPAILLIARAGGGLNRITKEDLKLAITSFKDRGMYDVVVTQLKQPLHKRKPAGSALKDEVSTATGSRGRKAINLVRRILE
jgi:hypothetical protein